MLETNTSKTNTPEEPGEPSTPTVPPVETTPPPPEGIFEENNSVPGAPEIDLNTPIEQIEARAKAEPEADDTDLTDDPKTDHAVEEISKTEGDEILKAEDEAVERAFIMKPNLWERFKNAAAKWWGNPRKRYTTLAILAAVILVVTFVPIVRYFVLNNVGFRSHASIQVLDSTTGLPLRNVNVTLSGKTTQTDITGKATLQDVKLGKQTLTIHKVAFASVQKLVTVGVMGVTVPGVSLKAVGSQFTFSITNLLSGKPLSGAEVVSGQSTALSDMNGKAILTVQPTDGKQLLVKVQATGYRSQSLSVDPTSTQPSAVSLVSSVKEVFISKASGKYDLYSVDVDGQNRQILLAGTGSENQNIVTSVSPDNSEVALVSTRDNQRDADGYLLSTLTLINISDGSTQTLEHAEQVSIIGWSGSKLIYETVIAGASAANPNRQRIISYDFSDNKRVQLVSANYFNVQALVSNVLYYGVSSTDPNVTPSFVRIGADGTGKQVLLAREVWSLFRADYKTFYLQSPSAWASYTIGAAITKPANAPTDFTSRQYLDSPDGSKSLWVDTRDGKGVLLSYDIAADKDTIIVTQSGLTQVLRYIDKSTVIYRVTDAQETADYVVSLDGGQPRKITDVTGIYSGN